MSSVDNDKNKITKVEKQLCKEVYTLKFGASLRNWKNSCINIYSCTPFKNSFKVVNALPLVFLKLPADQIQSVKYKFRFSTPKY